jgi:hypothetical protein
MTTEKQLAEEALARACEHLKLERQRIILEPPKRRMKFLGTAMTIGTSIAYIRYKAGQDEVTLRNTIAHEARHVWHRWHNVLHRDERTGLWVWEGTEFVPLKQSFKRLAYHLEPDEDDARAYARYFTRTFYGQDSYVAEVKTERIRDMFLD